MSDFKKTPLPSLSIDVSNIDTPSIDAQSIGIDQLQLLNRRALAAGVRTLWLIAGQRQWCQQTAETWLTLQKNQKCIWCGNHAPSAIETSGGSQLSTLGQDIALAVVDAHDEFDPNMLGAISGALQAGGTLLLLLPDRHEWPHYKDNFMSRYHSEKTSQHSLSHFILRSAQILYQSAHAGMILQNGLVRASVIPEFTDEAWSPQGNGSAIAMQRAVVDQIVDGLMSGINHHVLLADRGRGKSTALGMIASDLAARRHRWTVLVTAPVKSNVKTIFSVFQRISDSSCDIRYAAYDALIDESRPGSLTLCPEHTVLIIDEAAALPLPVLKQLTVRFPRLVLATTVQGYEGSGRGFLHRFLPFLANSTEKVCRYVLSKPMRWSSVDMLEPLINKIIFHEPVTECVSSYTDGESSARATLPQNSGVVRQYSLQAIETKRIFTSSLIDDELLLRKIFKLLSDAHYQTRPSDFRQFLDDPQLRIYGVFEQKKLLAVAIVSCEGQLPAGKAHQVLAGSARWRGNLLAQALLLAARDSDIADFSVWRIARIAVSPGSRRQGIATQLVEHIFQQARKNKADVLGTSFGVHIDNLSFWAQQKIKPVILGLRQDRASGVNSMMMAAALSERASALVRSLNTALRADWWCWRDDELAQLDPQVRTALDALFVPYRGNTHEIKGRDRMYIKAFIENEIDYEKVSPAIKRYFAGQTESILSKGAPILFARMEEGLHWLQISQRWPRYSGKRQLVTEIRRELKQLLDADLTVP